jgi:hypothetical protein
MEDIVEVSIPVSRAAASALSSRAARALAGRVLAASVRPAPPDSDPLAFLIAQLKAEIREVGSAPDEIEADAIEAGRRA